MARTLVAATAVGLWLSMSCAAHAQLPDPAFGSGKITSPLGKQGDARTSLPESKLTAIAPSAIPARSREAEAHLQDVRRLGDGAGLDGITRALPSFLEEAEELAEATNVASASTPRRELEDLRLRGQVLLDRLSAWQRQLGQQNDRREREAQAMRQLQQTWELTRQNLVTRADAPKAALARTEQVLSDLAEALALLAERAERLFELQERLQAAQQSVDANIERVRSAQARARELLLSASSRSVWAMFTPSSYPGGTLPALKPHPREHLTLGFRAFFRTYGRRLPFHALLLLGFLSGTLLLAKRARRRLQTLGQAIPGLLLVPGGSALFLLLILARFVYPRAMSAVDDALGLASLVTLYVVAPALANRAAMLAPLRGLIGVLGLHHVFLLLHLDTPWHELGMAISAGLLLASLSWSTRVALESTAEGDSTNLDRVTRVFGRAAVLTLALSLLAGLVGHLALFGYLVDGVTGASYWLLLSIALNRVLSTLLEAGLGTRRLRALRSMQLHGRIIEARTLAFARVLGIGLFVFASLHAFGLLELSLEWLELLMDRTAHVGSWHISLGDLTRFALAMYVTALLARLASFSLEEDILPRMQLARGVPATISRLTRYLVLAMGFIMAVGAAGVDMSRVALLASALSVGIGFGLQTVVNNFVSGLLLIFERPVRVGDIIQIDALIGEVRSIGIRSSTMHTAQGAEVIVPNADLISNRVVNWTLSDQSRRVDVPIGVGYGSDPKQVLALLQGCLTGVAGLAHTPEPACLFLGFGDSALNFEVRMWVSRNEDWPLVRSAAVVAMHAALCGAGIEIPFPQRDLHVRSVDGDTLAALRRLDTAHKSD